jgi:hypothetical protein
MANNEWKISVDWDDKEERHSRTIGGVLCQWFGKVEPDGVALIDAAADSQKERERIIRIIAQGGSEGWIHSASVSALIERITRKEET